MSNAHVTLTLTTEQADTLIELVDRENTATKNRLVSAVLATTDYRAQAEHLALLSQEYTALRANIAHSLNARR
jgi:hypothetical protein